MAAGIHPRAKRPVTGLLVVLAAFLAVPAAADAALPKTGTRVQAHDHDTPGRNWHVQMAVSKTNRRVIETLVVYAEICKATVLKTRISISPDGEISAAGAGQGKGEVAIVGRFTDKETIEGTVRLTRGTCDTGGMAFMAETDRRAGQHIHGPAFPDIGSASIKQLRQAQALRRNVWKASEKLFPTYQAALKLDYKPTPNLKPVPQFFHVRNTYYAHDGVIFRSTRPESLVYWWRPKGKHILVGFMFRVPKGPRPAYAGPIPIYHQHNGLESTSAPMTHVWLTNNLVTAWANCAPIDDFEAVLPGFRWKKADWTIPNAAPCPKLGSVGPAPAG